MILGMALNYPVFWIDWIEVLFQHILGMKEDSWGFILFEVILIKS